MNDLFSHPDPEDAEIAVAEEASVTDATDDSVPSQEDTADMDAATQDQIQQVNLPDGYSYDEYELIKQAAIEKQRKKLAEERAADLNTVKVLVTRHGFKWSDIRAPQKSRGKVPPKYRDPVSGALWTGRGRAPLWIRDHADRSKFLIDAQDKN